MQLIPTKVVYYQSGENRGTCSPKCLLSDFDGNLNEKTWRFVSWDCDIKIEVDLYEVREVPVPEGWSFEKWLKNYINFKFALYISGEGAISELNEAQLDQLLQLEEYHWYILGALYAKKDKSFFGSLYNQFLSWLDNRPETARFKRPFTEKQYGALAKCRIRPLDAKRESDAAYFTF